MTAKWILPDCFKCVYQIKIVELMLNIEIHPTIMKVMQEGISDLHCCSISATILHPVIEFETLLRVVQS